MERSYKEYLNAITTLVFDVDGVLTNGTIMVTTNGEMYRTMNIKDGYALKTAVDEGMNVCIISGGSNEGVRKRLQGLGITDIHLGTHQKTETLHAYFAEKGIHIICDKPLAFSSEEANSLKDIIENKKIIFALTHNYTGYPMVRHARSMVKEGDLGKIRVIQAEYPQDWLTTKAEDTGLKQAEWRTDPKRSGGGGCIGDIGTHAFNLIRFITELELDELSADIHTFVKGRKLDDNAQIMLRFKSGAKGAIWSSQVAVGNENNLKIRVYGENGGLEWKQEDPNYLYYTKFGKPTEKITRGSSSANKEANDVTRIPPGHPEGYLEGFANIYTDVFKRLNAQINNEKYNELDDCYPTINDGVEGMKFIETVINSSKNNSKWTQFNN